MEKQILIELKRIKMLMGYNENNSISTLFEQDFEGGDGSVDVSSSGSVDPSEEQYPLITLGPKNKQPYPIMFDIEDGIPVMGDKKTKQPIIWKFTEGMSAKNFIPSNKMKIEVGDVKSADGSIKSNQEYFEQNGKKYCLPVKEFWEMHTKNGWIYKFQNPKNGKTFNVKLNQLPVGKCTNSGDGKTYSGLECSERCMGSNNGWAFDLNGFYETGTSKLYDPNDLKHMDPRSDDDIFWDKYGLWVEIAVGVAISFAAPYLAAGLVAIFAEGALAGTRMATLINTLSKAKYAGGGANWLVILCEVMGEGALLSPMISNYLSRGKNGDAMLALAMCLVPFLTELKSVKGFISKGFGSKSMADNVIKKIELNGGFESLFTKDEAAMRAFIDVILTKEEKEFFYVGVDLIKADNGKVLEKAFAEYIEKNGAGIEKLMAKGTGDSEIDIAVREMAQGFVDMTSVTAGKGLIPSFIRGTILIGPIVIGFKYGYDKLSKLGLKDEEIGKVHQNVANAIENSPYGKAMFKLNKSCGLGPEIPQEVVNKTIDNALKDPDFKKNYLEVNNKLYSQAADSAVKTTYASNEKIIIDAIYKQNSNKTENLKSIDTLKYFGSLDLLDKIIQKKGYELPTWGNERPTKYDQWTFSSGEIKGFVKFIGGDEGNFEIYINNKKIYPE